MRKIRTLMTVALVTSLMVATSCSDSDIYDPERHYVLVRYQSPVDSVDQQHTFQLTTNHTYSVSIKNGMNATRLEIYNDNPVESKDAELMSRVFVKDGQNVMLMVSVPNIQETIYAAVVDKDGLMTVTSVNPSSYSIDFSNPIASKQASQLETPNLMAYTYCYEEDFPEPGDYDYNDVVLRIALERTGENTMDIHTTLSAVGGLKLMSGAIRLVGYRYQDIDSIVAQDGKTLNNNVPSTSYELFKSDDILQKGRNGEAVLNLFVDAHWALGDDITEVNGDFKRYKYNVSREFNSDYDLAYAKSVTHRVYFKSSSNLNSFTQEMLDPFLMAMYNGARLETHLDEFVNAQVMYNYTTIDFKDLPWALKIPTRYFRYPLEGVQMGFRKEGYMFGAYMTIGHGFGEWIEDHRHFHDWYLYPTDGQVF